MENKCNAVDGLSDRVTHTAYRTTLNCNVDKCDGLCLHCARILGSHTTNRPFGSKSSSADYPRHKALIQKKQSTTQTNRSKYNENIRSKRNTMFTLWFVLLLHRVKLERSAIRITTIIFIIAHAPCAQTVYQ